MVLWFVRLRPSSVWAVPSPNPPVGSSSTKVRAVDEAPGLYRALSDIPTLRGRRIQSVVHLVTKPFFDTAGTRAAGRSHGAEEGAGRGGWIGWMHKGSHFTPRARIRKHNATYGRRMGRSPGEWIGIVRLGRRGSRTLTCHLRIDTSG